MHGCFKEVVVVNGYAQQFKTTSYSDGGSFLPPNFEKSYLSSWTSYDRHSRLIGKLKQICAHKNINNVFVITKNVYFHPINFEKRKIDVT
jgi:hypothetical protein